jgi:transketolase
MERFEARDAESRATVLPPGVPRVAVEAGITRGWHHLVGDTGAVVGLDRFGLSGPGEEVVAELGFTADRVADTAREVVRAARSPAS